MTPTFMLTEVINPGLKFMTQIVGSVPIYSREARVMLLAIAGQESNFKEREQIGGPARSYWQFERLGGLLAVMANTKTAAWLRTICDALDIEYNSLVIFEAMAWNDHLAVALARLNLWLIPGTLPTIGDEDGAWLQYLHHWAPGKPDKTRWHASYQAALDATK